MSLDEGLVVIKGKSLWWEVRGTFKMSEIG